MGRSASYRSSLPKHRLALIGPSFLAESRTSAILRLLRACTLTSVTEPASPMIAMITVEPIQNWLAGLSDVHLYGDGMRYGSVCSVHLYPVWARRSGGGDVYVQIYRA